jgi:hypothetical protein
MFSLDQPKKYLARLAPMSAAGWHALGAQTFPGELSIATDNSVYRFNNGIFLGRAQKSARSFEYPPAMRAMRLVGFLNDEEGGLWSLSPRWRAGTHAVLWKPDLADDQSFVLTSPTTGFSLEEPQAWSADPEPTPSPWVLAERERSGVVPGPIARPPAIRPPLPSSMTRLHSASAASAPGARESSSRV